MICTIFLVRKIVTTDRDSRYFLFTIYQHDIKTKENGFFPNFAFRRVENMKLLAALKKKTTISFISKIKLLETLQAKTPTIKPFRKSRWFCNKIYYNFVWRIILNCL